jgi:hypothetical protein
MLCPIVHDNDMLCHGVAGDHDYVVPYTGSRAWVYDMGLRQATPWHSWSISGDDEVTKICCRHTNAPSFARTNSERCKSGMLHCKLCAKTTTCLQGYTICACNFFSVRAGNAAA